MSILMNIRDEEFLSVGLITDLYVKQDIDSIVQTLMDEWNQKSQLVQYYTDIHDFNKVNIPMYKTGTFVDDWNVEKYTALRLGRIAGENIFLGDRTMKLENRKLMSVRLLDRALLLYKNPEAMIDILVFSNHLDSALPYIPNSLFFTHFYNVIEEYKYYTWGYFSFINALDSRLKKLIVDLNEWFEVGNDCKRMNPEIIIITILTYYKKAHDDRDKFVEYIESLENGKTIMKMVRP